MKLGDIVREFRQSHGMTMQEFADLALLSKGYISMLEKGRNPRNGLPITPSIDTYAKVARAMNMTAEELLAKAKGEDVAIPAPAAEPMGLTARDERDIEHFDLATYIQNHDALRYDGSTYRLNDEDRKALDTVVRLALRNVPANE